MKWKYSANGVQLDVIGDVEMIIRVGMLAKRGAERISVSDESITYLLNGHAKFEFVQEKELVEGNNRQPA